MLSALLNGDIEYWLKGEVPTSRSIVIRPADLAAFDRIVDLSANLRLSVARSCNQADAAEILNIKSPVVSTLAGTLGLDFTADGFSLAVSREAVLKTAAAVAFDAEISRHLRLKYHQVENALVGEGVRRKLGGWCRNDLIEKGILPALLAGESA